MVNQVLILSLVVWRVTAFIVHETGPFRIFERLRFGRELCFDCAGVWVSGIFSIFLYNEFTPFLLSTLACSAGAIFFERFSDALYEMS